MIIDQAARPDSIAVARGLPCWLEVTGITPVCPAWSGTTMETASRAPERTDTSVMRLTIFLDIVASILCTE